MDKEIIESKKKGRFTIQEIKKNDNIIRRGSCKHYSLHNPNRFIFNEKEIDENTFYEMKIYVFDGQREDWIKISKLWEKVFKNPSDASFTYFDFESDSSKKSKKSKKSENNESMSSLSKQKTNEESIVRHHSLTNTKKAKGSGYSNFLVDLEQNNLMLFRQIRARKFESTKYIGETLLRNFERQMQITPETSFKIVNHHIKQFSNLNVNSCSSFSIIS